MHPCELLREHQEEQQIQNGMDKFICEKDSILSENWEEQSVTPIKPLFALGGTLS